jgi:hypothetical protein
VAAVPILAIAPDAAAALPFALSIGGYVVGLVLDVVLLILAIVAALAVLKLPALLERIAGQLGQLQQGQREALAELRKVTTQG